jgi:hypothetical protein
MTWSGRESARGASRTCVERSLPVHVPRPRAHPSHLTRWSSSRVASPARACHRLQSISPDRISYAALRGSPARCHRLDEEGARRRASTHTRRRPRTLGRLHRRVL